MTNGIIFCVCSISAISVLQCALIQWQTERNKIQEKKVPPKSRPMMSLSARSPSTLSSSASERPEKKSYGSQSPWSAKAEKDGTTGQSVVDRHMNSARYSGWDDGKAWSSQERKVDKSMDDRTEQPVVTFWAKTHESQSSFSHEKTQHVIVEEKNLVTDRGTPLSSQGHSNSSLETTKQNQNCHWNPDHS